MATNIEKHASYEAKNGKTYKIHAAHFLGNVGNHFGYLMVMHSHEHEFEYTLLIPRDVLLKKWKLPNRTKEEDALIELGIALAKLELDKSNEQTGFKLMLPAHRIQDTLRKTLDSLGSLQ
ncbi:MAG: hypothetical protein HY586_01525 [Candidatus Omnitrophica bacterium]|nr:hypothetical protein [Candidatus Omnitrophota bacterium]